MAQRPMVPNLGALNSGSLLGPETDRALQQVLQSAQGVLEAKKTREIVQSLVGSEPPNLQGMGELMQGVGSAIRSVAEAQSVLTKQILENIKPNGDGQRQDLVPLLIAMMQQHTQMLVTLLQEHVKQSEERWRMLLEAERERHERERQELKEELERAKSSVSPVDEVMQGKILPALLDKLTESWNSDPITQLGRLIKQAQDLKSLGSLLGGADKDEYSEGRLKWEELQIQKTRILREHEARLEELRARREFWQNLPKSAQAVAESVVRVLGGLGFVPANTIPPEAESAARSLLTGRPSSEGREEM